MSGVRLLYPAGCFVRLREAIENRAFYFSLCAVRYSLRSGFLGSIRLGRFPASIPAGAVLRSRPGFRASAAGPRTTGSLFRRLSAGLFGKSKRSRLTWRRPIRGCLPSGSPIPPPSRAELKAGDGVDVVVNQDENGLYQAVSIQPNPEIARTIQAKDRIAPIELAGQPPEDLRTEPPPTILVRPDQRYGPDEAPPKLKRGIPAARGRAAQRRRRSTAAGRGRAGRRLRRRNTAARGNGPARQCPHGVHREGARRGG